MKKPKNIKAAKELIEKYRSITLKELKEAGSLEDFDGEIIAGRITGFGFSDECLLCKALNKAGTSCSGCIYVEGFACFRDGNKKTYDAIKYANTPRKLQNAFRKRADHIEKIIKPWNK